jgi:hypothetical protein
MPEQDVLVLCPVFNMPCIGDKCTGYEVHTKNRFKNMKTGKYIPLDQLSLYSNLSPEELAKTVEREVTIVKECRQLGKIIEIINFTDHLIPKE